MRGHFGKYDQTSVNMSNLFREKFVCYHDGVREAFCAVRPAGDPFPGIPLIGLGSNTTTC